MGADTGIEWAHHTWSPWLGCTKVSAACDHCYAESWAKRSGLVDWGPHGRRSRTSAAYWKQPEKWNRQAEAAGTRLRVFPSLCDPFDNHRSIDPAWRAEFWAVIRRTPWLDWLLLTKRPQNIAGMLPLDWGAGWPNVWLGATVENQAEADRRIPPLLLVPAAVRFLSCEPLLGPVDLGGWLAGETGCQGCDDGGDGRNHCSRFDIPREQQCPENRAIYSTIEHGPLDSEGAPKGISVQRVCVDWVIAGGESGQIARPSHPDWFRSLRDQCGGAGVPFLFKQWGEWAPVCAIDENQVPDEQLYHPRLARHRPDGPRRCKVSQLVVQASGRTFHVDEWSAVHGEGRDIGDFAYAAGTGAMLFMAIGKAAAGRMLDGREWNEFPEARR